MQLKELTIISFRNHLHTHITCAEKVNVFTGRNGEGKTNILEAISYLCLTKSFFTASDSIVTTIGKDGFTLKGNFFSDNKVVYNVVVEYSKNCGGKSYAINSSKIDRMSKVVGFFPVVVVSPDHSVITNGSPADRRTFVDIALSQTSSAYLEHLIEYRRILRQRNRLLLQMKESGAYSQASLEPWNESLVKTGSLIVAKRAQFVQEFAPYICDAFAMLTNSQEQPSIKYEASVLSDTLYDQHTTEQQYYSSLSTVAEEERRAGYTLVGPHRDEFLFSINGMDVRNYASQGQHKTFLVALKMAEYQYIRERSKETPILLLDDVFSELDAQRIERLFSYLSNVGQTFITTTDDKIFRQYTTAEDNGKLYVVEKGTVRHAA